MKFYNFFDLGAINYLRVGISTCLHMYMLESACVWTLRKKISMLLFSGRYVRPPIPTWIPSHFGTPTPGYNAGKQIRENLETYYSYVDQQV